MAEQAPNIDPNLGRGRLTYDKKRKMIVAEQKELKPMPCPAWSVWRQIGCWFGWQPARLEWFGVEHKELWTVCARCGARLAKMSSEASPGPWLRRRP